MLLRIDAAHDALGEGVVTLHVAVDEKGKQPQESLMDLFVKGADRSLVSIREGKQKGRKILTVGDRVWLIVPGAGRPIPVSKGQRLMGAASFGDVARIRFAELYAATLRETDEAVSFRGGETLCRVLDLTALRAGAAYPKAVLWVSPDDGLPRRLRLSLASGKEAKDVLYTSYDGQKRIGTMEIRDLLAAGRDNVTALEFTHYENRPLDPQWFEPEGARTAP